MNKNNLAIIFVALMILVTILSLAWSVEFNWPDYVHVDYGFPLTWGTHILNTIHGPVDIWKVNLEFLILDLVVWLCILIAGLFVILHVKK
ncbi:hypothetical protein KEJ17_08435 [Candidatus Bathyarchaeota archaeon]|nr:hypothetical protein [Candidatus Bathyarchaeota archaeon]